jgi:hypothetical protein
MSSWIDFHALWQILVVGMLAGAGLPALFAIGLRVLAPPRRQAAAAAGAQPQGTGGAVTSSPLNIAGASACFAIVLAAVGYGIYLIVAGS